MTGTTAGYATASATSAATGAVALGQIIAATPTISGTFEVGGTLTAMTGNWTPGNVSFQYAWYANGKLIASSATPTLTLAKEQKNKAISVQVTGSATGYVTVSKTSSETDRIAK